MTNDVPVEEEISVFYPINVLLRNLKRILRTGLVVAVLAAALIVLRGRSFTSSLIFVPQATESSVSGISSIAAQFGFALPTAETTESPEFYEALVRSRPILENLVRREYPVENGDAASLVEIFGIEADSEAEAVVEATQELRESIGADADPVTGMITVGVRAESPELARQIAAAILSEVQQFNQSVRTSQAAAEREFAEERLVDSRRELRSAEDSLQRFLQANRDYRSAPALVFQAERMERNIALRQEVVNSLTQAYEQARLAEVRNTPVITVVQPPFTPVRPDRKNLPLKFIAAFVVGAGLATAWAYIRAGLEEARTVDRTGSAEFARLTSGVSARLRRLAFWRRSAAA